MTTESRGSDSVRNRVLVVSHLFPTPTDPASGPWIAEQVDSLSEFVDVEVLCCARTDDASVVRESGVKVSYRDTSSPFGAGRLGLLASSWRYQRRLRTFLAEMPLKPDLLHSHFGFPDAAVVGVEARRARIPHVATLHGSDVERVLPRADAPGAALRNALSRASATVCVSSDLAARTRAAMGARFPVAVVPSGVNEKLFHLEDGDIRKGLLYVGSFRKIKNVDVLIEALADLRTTMPVHATLVGEGELREQLENLVRERGLGDLVTFVGSLDRTEVARRMHEARALVLPSEREGWGAVVAEALACGTPVVASNVGGIPEILGSSDGGILVTPGDSRQLAAGMLEVLQRDWDPVAVAASSNAPTSRASAQRLAELYKGILQ